MERWVGLDHRRALPPFPKQTLVHAARTHRGCLRARARDRRSCSLRTFSRITAWPSADWLRLRFCAHSGADVVVSESVPEGRAALSQGMIATAKQHARRATWNWIATSAMAATSWSSSRVRCRCSGATLRICWTVRNDSRRFRSRAFDPVEYVMQTAGRNPVASRRKFSIFRNHKVGYRLFFHAHCQQKTIGCAEPTETLLREIGFDVVTSNVECCGMAGSFGYKKDFYDLSMAVGADLFGQVVQQERDGGARQLIASGTSCTEQLHAGFERTVLHPDRTARVVARGSESPPRKSKRTTGTRIRRWNRSSGRGEKHPKAESCARREFFCRSSPARIAIAAGSRDFRWR